MLGERKFKADLFAHYPNQQQIAWPTLESGYLNQKYETFRSMAKFHSQIPLLRKFRHSLGQMRFNKFRVGADGLNRTMLNALVVNPEGISRVATSSSLAPLFGYAV